MIILCEPVNTPIDKPNNRGERRENLLLKKNISPRIPCKKTARYAAIGVCGLIAALMINTIIVALRISPRFSEKCAINEMIMMAAEDIIIPLNGICAACKSPPSIDSLKAQRAVNREREMVLSC